jgi:hypothetical protein
MSPELTTGLPIHFSAWFYTKVEISAFVFCSEIEDPLPKSVMLLISCASQFIYTVVVSGLYCVTVK